MVMGTVIQYIAKKLKKQSKITDLLITIISFTDA